MRPTVEGYSRREFYGLFRTGYLFIGYGLLAVATTATVIALFSGGDDFVVFFLVLTLGFIPFTVGAACGVRVAWALGQRSLSNNGSDHPLLPQRHIERLALHGPIPMSIFLLFMTYLGVRQPTGPSEDSLVAEFSTNRVALERLAKMVKSDKNLAEASCLYSLKGNKLAFFDKYPKASISGVEAFQSLLKKTGILQIDYHEEYAEVDLEKWSVGCAVCGHMHEGYAYRPTPPKRLFARLDRSEAATEYPADRRYRHIEGNWYLYIEFDD